MKVLVPDTIALEPLSTDDEFTTYDASRPFAADTSDAEVLVVWRNSAENLRSAVADLPRLRLVQALAAGADQIVGAGFASSVLLASGRSLHDRPVAEHALALTLAAVRRLDVLAAAQQEHRWDEEFLEAQRAPETDRLYTLEGARVTIWGFGSIAAHLAPALTALGALVTGVATRGGIRHGYTVVGRAELVPLLGETDVLLSLLPASLETECAVDAALLGHLKPGAVFVNVGRGATVDEPALVAALRSGRLRVAALDVARVEPLPADSELWDVPNLILTPHAAGNRPRGADALLDRNLAALRSDSPIVNEVAR